MNPIQFYEFGKNVYLKFTQQFDNAYWVKVLSGFTNFIAVTPNAITAPNGTLTADKIYNNSATINRAILYENQLRIRSGTQYAMSIYAKAGTHGFLQIYGRDTVFGTSNLTAYANFDLVNGIVGTVGAGMTARMQLDNNGWYRCLLSGTTAQKGIGIFAVAVVDSLIAVKFGLAAANDEIYVWGAKVETGGTATDYKNEFTQAVYTGASPL